MINKKFTYKVPSIVALTFAGTALTTHHAHAAENTQDQTKNKNVLNDEQTQQQGEQIQAEISKPTTNISGTQAYQDPTQVKSQDTDQVSNYDAHLDDLNSDSTEEANTYTNETASNSETDAVATQQSDATADQQNTEANEESSTQEDTSSKDETTTDQQNSKVNDESSTQEDTSSKDETTTDHTTTQENSSAESQDMKSQDSNATEDATTNSNTSESSVNEQQSTEDTTEQSAQLDTNNTNVEATQQEEAPTTSNSNVATQENDTNSDQASTSTNEVKSDDNEEDTSAKKQDDNTTDEQISSDSTVNAKQVNDSADSTVSTQDTNDNNSALETNHEDSAVAVATKSDSTDNALESNEQTTTTEPVARKVAVTSNNDTNEDTTSDVTPMLRTANYTANTSQATTTRAAVKKEATTKSTLQRYTPQVNSSINNYIRKNNFTAPNYEQDIASYLPQYNYRYGKPEGIVMHDTANDNSTITGEVNYMKNNYNSAFVHAYVDGNRIIETANTDYLAWGAGAPANERFIHVELVHTHDYDSFARSINNYADYAATNLRYYGLKPDSAEYDGAGTVWTHKAVSTYLGGTDHSDPHGYLAAHNYSYDELYDLIYEKYLIQTGQAADWGTTSSNNSGSTNTDDTPKTGQLSVKANSGVGRINSKNNGVYTTVYDKNGKATNRTNQTLKVTKTATLGQEKYYLVSDYNKGNLIGWVKQNDVNYNTAKSVAKINKSYKIKPGEVLYSVPWGTSSQKVGTVSGKSAQTFKATKQQQIGKTNYLYGTVNKVSGWVSLSKLTSNSTTTPSTDTNKLVVTNLTNQQGTVNKTNSGVYTSVYDKQGVQKSYVNGKTFKLSKKAALGSKQFYLITDNKTNTNMGWMLTKDIQVKEATKANNTVNKTTNVSKIGQLSTQNSGIKTTVFDEQGKDASKFSGKTYTITKQRTQGDNTYVLIQNTNQKTPIGWVNTKDINTRNLTKAEAKKGQYTIKPTNNGLYAIPWGTKAQQIDTLNKVGNNKFNASKSLFVDKDEYIYGNVNNKTGWIAAKDLNQATTQSNPTPLKYDYIIYNENGQYYLDPTATKGAGSLRDFYEGIFDVFEQQTINGITWYHGKLSNGKTVWIKASDLRKELVKYYATGMTLDQAVALQKGLNTKPQIQRVPGKWEDATSAEIKSAMDSNKLVNDATQKYQFLRLDKAQNINATDLNKLLVGKGILEGQGAAFSQAAKENNINEVYLISHALLETGNGTSTLANGGNVVNNKVVTNQPTKYYNMFGIGAVDHDAVKQGFITAKNNGWDSVKKAIVGGAQFIASSYINQGQNTLYKMRWNPDNPGVHQYATDVAWAKHNATRIKSFYDSMDKVGKYFDVNTYK
ncbi:glucosaminidase domain-containing protein [Staphylococcus gallinarum]|uniref:glucosaminidase domain-containing protein n=1 Tax=Staphylococcus gallinarum TaxID=1293 RepID=UPI001E3215E5|nr:glucosaminidase domain-containing protein [Staphylococcus gallinarum]MCD8828586.1 glucosaminidase domain-containing protein [Staphylococcus gallinarum]MDN6412315.1 glucosaminidase domain-containing protein [Staphylococcus gallinarum]MEB6054631.1 glucosaminidase domain-containing protein [Staphylococcus gallinarum]